MAMADVQAETEPGWYRDHWGRYQHRWWDGESWTSRVSSDGLVGEDEAFDPTASPCVVGTGQTPAQVGTSSPKRWKARAIGWFVAAAVLVVVLLMVRLSDTSSSSGSSGLSFLSPSSSDVSLEVTGSTREADITYSFGGDISQQSGVDVPLINASTQLPGIHRSGVPSGSLVQLSAQNHEESGSITCTIRVNGSVVDTNTSYGGFTIADCHASI